MQNSAKHQLNLSVSFPSEDDSVKDRLASQVLELLVDFEMALSESKRKYPAQEFFAFASAARRYINLTRKTSLCAGMWQ